MKKITVICPATTDIDATPTGPSLQQMLERTTPLDNVAHEIVWATKSFTVPEGRFLTDGDTHNIVISFEGAGAVRMRLTIDAEIVYEVDTKQQYRGKIELHMSDGLVVDFLWDLVHIPKTFSFYTRNLPSHLMAMGGGGGSSSSGSEYGDFSFYGIDWEDYCHVHALEILAS